MAYQARPHAQVECVRCHVGRAPAPLVESKLAGTRQLCHVITNQVPKPVPSPVRTIGPRATPASGAIGPRSSTATHADDSRIRQRREEHRDDDHAAAPRRRRQPALGDRHRHSLAHEHRQRDRVRRDRRQRETIPVRAGHRPPGTSREFIAEGATPEQIAAGTRRRMDCMDCHNRPAHTCSITPERAVDTAIAQGRIPRDAAVRATRSGGALKGEYPEPRRRARGIDAAAAHVLRRSAASRSAARSAGRCRGAGDLAHNVFPAMKVKWGTYPNNIGPRRLRRAVSGATTTATRRPTGGHQAGLRDCVTRRRSRHLVDQFITERWFTGRDADDGSLSPHGDAGTAGDGRGRTSGGSLSAGHPVVTTSAPLAAPRRTGCSARAPRRLARAAAQAPAGEYAGEETCLSCHDDRAYKGTKHGLAPNDAHAGRDAGCESCHGPGKAHAESGDATLIATPAR